MERLWRLRDVSSSWDVDYMTLWRWAQSGKLPVVRLPGGGLRVKDSEVQRILREQEPVTA